MAAFTPIFGQNLRSQPPRRPASGLNNEPRQLEFSQAMKDFKTMFPTLDDEVIEAVLRANNGLVDATIDQLLTMGAGDTSVHPSSDQPHLPSYTARDPAEPPPAYTPRDRPAIPDPTPQLFRRPLPARPYSNWNPPLLGALPDDFLRLTPVRKSRQTKKREENAESELKQFLEDERLAIFLQNEEFMRELRHNKDFMMSLERDRQSAQSREHHRRSSGRGRTLPHIPEAEEEEHKIYVPAPVVRPPQVAQRGTGVSGSTVPAEPMHDTGAAAASNSTGGHHVSEDAALREKLRHMGKSTRKQFDKLARMFQRRNVHRAEIIASGSAASTANLLEDCEEEEDNNEGLLNAMGTGRLEIMQENDETPTERDESEKVNTTNQRASPASNTNKEPIVFFAEDNEFQFKEEK